MNDAVIVSVARTGLAKSWRGALNMTHGATMGGHVVAQAIARAKLDPGEVEDVVMGCANPEGAKILEEGIALRASDIDIVYLTGYGFPVYRGSPMFYADTQGLPNVVATMQKFAANPHGDPSFWTPAALLAKLAAEGRTFNS